jgi:hypothetical protein
MSRYPKVPVTAPGEPSELALAPNDKTPSSALIERLPGGEFELQFEHRRPES